MVTFYVDLDRTLYQTHLTGEIFELLMRLYPDNQTISNGLDKWHKYKVLPQADEGDLETYYHDFVAQIEEAGLDYAVIFDQIVKCLGDGQLEYAGAGDFIDQLKKRGRVVVLTYGEDRYQRLKSALCPSIIDLDVVTVTRPKAQYLNDSANEGDWIIDDKLIIDLEPGIHAIKIGHDGQIDTDATTFAEVIHIIDESNTK